MKEANNNEVDLLLRALAKGRRTVPLADGSGVQQGTSDHLDADELNSYAEGVAPEAAKGRYTQHLADCDTCRGLVVSLTQASGVAARYEVTEQPRGLTFLQKLSALFAQPVWHYAVPAMILTTVIGIGLLALRQQGRNDFVAKNETPSNAEPAGPAGSAPAAAPTTSPQVFTDNGAKSATPPVELSKLDSLKGEKIQPPLEEDETRGVTVPKAAPAKDAPAVGGVMTATEARPSSAIESKAGASAAPPPPVAAYDKSAELAKEQPSKREDQDRGRDEGFRMQNDDVHGPNRSRNNNAPNASQQIPDVASRRGGPSNVQQNKKSNEAETRTVMGRHFTREGGAWVDTAYDSRATTKITRGSDQYRALIADEPAIRTIAEQLDGVVVVVWKSRAYRIQ